MNAGAKDHGIGDVVVFRGRIADPLRCLLPAMSSGAREEMNMHIQLRLIVSVLALLPSTLCMSQTAEAQRASMPHHTIVPLPREGLTQERILKLLERGFEVLSGDPDKAGAPFVIRIYNIENQIVV